MLKIIEVIEDANSKNCSLPALALALTLPDICSQIEYPNETNVLVIRATVGFGKLVSCAISWLPSN